jgi:SAM-dependent methyltransferase
MDWVAESKRFDEAAEYYDHYRPSYPDELIEWIESKAGLKPSSKILEIGAGSGKASELFLSRGYELLCIEPGAQLAEVGRRKHRDKKLEYLVTRFEHWDEPKRSFDLIFSATAYHWVPQPVGYKKCANTLKVDGHLALFWNMYFGEGAPLYQELVSLCNQYGLVYFQNRQEMEMRIQTIALEMNESEFFHSPEVLRYPWKQSYNTESFIGFIKTGNGFLGKSRKEKLDIETEIIAVFDKMGGSVDIELVSTLFFTAPINKER